MLSDLDIVRKVKGAFLPKRCAVEVCDEESQLRLKLLDHDGSVIIVPTLTLSNLRDEGELERALRRLRFRLERQGRLLH